MDKFVTSIKRKYRERLINRENHWPPCKSNKLVRLELVEGVKGEGYFAKHQRGQEKEDIKRTPIEYVELFKVESGKRPVRKILIEGDAGIGKTTLSIAVCEDWANDKLFQQFKLLLLLPLRHKKVATVSSLPELLKLFHSNQELCTSVAEYLSDTEGDELLIIVDGWDEVGKSDQLKNSFLYELLFEDHLSFASVVVTSRHSASVEFHKQSYFDRFVEITGFDNESIVKYIQSEFANDPHKADHLRQQLKDNPLVESVCSIPLNCTIICHLWQLNHKESLPTTMTKLYSMIIRNVILRNLGKDTNRSTEILKLPAFNDLPEDLKQPWLLLCNFAYETMIKDQLIFSGEELSEGSGIHGNVFCFGLLQQSLFLLDDGYGKSYHFLHRTFQEFLAAFHLAKTICESDGSVIEYNCEVLTENSNIFFFGIFFNELYCDNYQAIQPHLAKLCALYKKSDRKNINHLKLLLCHSAFEANNKNVYNDVIHALVMKADDGIVLFRGSRSAHDCAAVINVVDHMQDGKINIYFDECGIRQDQINLLHKVLQKHKKVQVGELSLSGNKLESHCIERLFSGIQNNFQSLLFLTLADNMIKTVKFLEQRFDMLIGVYLSNNPLGVSGMNMLQTAIAGDSLPSLELLSLDNALTKDTGVSTDSWIREFSKFLKTLSAHCPHLSELDLSQNNIGQTGIIELAKIMSQHNKVYTDHHRWLSQLSLNRINIGDKGLCAFIETLDCRWCFDRLFICDNDIHATSGLVCLLEAIRSGKILFTSGVFGEIFALDNNPLGHKGLIEIGKLLCSDCYSYSLFIKGLSLSKCQLTDYLTCDQDVFNEIQIGEQLCQMHQNITLNRLYLDGISFTGDRIHILAGIMHLCLFLEVLSTRDCAILSSDFSKLLEILAQFQSSNDTNKFLLCCSLDCWMLNNNKIDDNGVSALIKHRQSPPLLFPRLKVASKDGTTWKYNFAFNGNPISDEMIEILNEKLNRTEVVQVQKVMMDVSFLFLIR